MQVRKAVAGSVLGVGLTAMAIGGAGSAFASTGAGEDGGAGAPGNVSVTHTTTVNKTNVNVLNGNRLLNGTRILSGNTTVIKVELFNGAFSNNVFNSGANSFNTDNSKIWAKNSFNTVTITKTDTKNTTIETNNSGHGQDGGPGQPGH